MIGNFLYRQICVKEKRSCVCHFLFDYVFNRCVPGVLFQFVAEVTVAPSTERGKLMDCYFFSDMEIYIAGYSLYIAA